MLTRSSQVFCLLFTIAIFSSCQKASVKLNSNPRGAEVAIYNPNSHSYEVQGKTPMVINEKTKLPAEIRSSDVWGITLHKPGYVVEHVLLDHKSNPQFEVNAKLRKHEDWVDNADEVMSDLAHKVGSQTLIIRNKIQNKKYKKAMQITRALVTDFPKAAIFYDLLGSIHYLLGNKDKAIGSYRKSLELRPEGFETRRILEDLTGEKLPALKSSLKAKARVKKTRKRKKRKKKK